MKKLKIITFSFISILVIGIVLTNTLINTNINTGIHKIDLEINNSKSVKISLESSNNTLIFNDNNSSISDIEKDYIESIFSFIRTNFSLKSGLYKLTF